MRSRIGQFYLGSSATLWQYLKHVCFIDVPIVTPLWRPSMVYDILTYIRQNWDVATNSQARWEKYVALF